MLVDSTTVLQRSLYNSELLSHPQIRTGGSDRLPWPGHTACTCLVPGGLKGTGLAGLAGTFQASLPLVPPGFHPSRPVPLPPKSHLFAWHLHLHCPDSCHHSRPEPLRPAAHDPLWLSSSRCSQSHCSPAAQPLRRHRPEAAGAAPGHPVPPPPLQRPGDDPDDPRFWRAAQQQGEGGRRCENRREETKCPATCWTGNLPGRRLRGCQAPRRLETGSRLAPRTRRGPPPFPERNPPPPPPRSPERRLRLLP